MATYSDIERSELMEVPVTDILKVLGRSTEHGADNMYFSPFRDEKCPSFHISRDGRRWYDFGTGKGGTVLTLVCQILNCDGGKGYDFLASVSRTFIRPDERPSGARRRETTGSPHKIRIHNVTRSFRDRGLLDYASSRGIDRFLLETWCGEVTFGYEGHKGFSNTAIGFLNNSGGWVLRAPDVKRCSCSDITTINIYGEVSDSPTSPSGIMLEGVFDFLSMMRISGEEWPKCDVCVLNSVSNIRKAQAWISAHGEIHCLFDHDDAGRKTLQELSAAHPGVKVDDWSGLYEGHKDLGEALTGGDAETLTTQYQSLWNKTLQKTFRKD